MRASPPPLRAEIDASKPRVWPASCDHTRSLRQHPGIAAQVDAGHIKRHDHRSHPWVNPSGIVPLGSPLALSRLGTREVRPLH